MVTIHILTYGHRYLLGRDVEASQEAVHAAVAADMKDREQAPFYVVSASHWGNVQVSTDRQTPRAGEGDHPPLVRFPLLANVDNVHHRRGEGGNHQWQELHLPGILVQIRRKSISGSR